MTSDPHHCRSRAQQCLSAAEKAKTVKAGEEFRNLAERWKRLANDLESSPPERVAEIVKRGEHDEMDRIAKSLEHGSGDHH